MRAMQEYNLKSTKVKYQPVYCGFSRDTANEIAAELGTKRSEGDSQNLT